MVSWPHFRASLMAPSFASAPLLAKKVRPPAVLPQQGRQLSGLVVEEGRAGVDQAG